MGRHCRILADGDDPLAGDSDGPGDRRIGVDRDDFGVLENEVGRLSSWNWRRRLRDRAEAPRLPDLIHERLLEAVWVV
jgi:hypothetical protein